LTDPTQPEEELRKGQLRRAQVFVRGVVQGVGYRPLVYRLAVEEGLAGSVGNDSDGVTIEIEGPEERVEAFLSRLRSDAPPLARVDSVTVRESRVATVPATPAGFHIVASEVVGRASTGIPADAATCTDCLRELLDPKDRRYRYPFLNCTNCGPRFTITRQIPYDRPQTSMAKFAMCPACQREYDDPQNRRFHAQPNACWDCGPRVWLVEIDGEIIPGEETLKGHDFSRAVSAAESTGALAPEACLSGDSQAVFPSPSASKAPTRQSRPDAIDRTVERLLAGQIMAIKGIGGFHLTVDATSQTAVTRLRERKHRYGKPMAVMVRDLEAARAVCALTAEEEALLTTAARPIVLARRREDSGIADGIAPGIPWLGIFLPYAPLQHLLFADPRVRALVMTSANLSEEPIAIDNDEALARLNGIADAFLMHDREILQRCDDSVTAVVDGAPQLIRRARGYVPLGVPLTFEAPPLLAVGGHLKNVFALARGRFAYQSQHLGDLENLTGLEFFKESLDHLMRTFEIEPQAVVHDLHPGYLSTQWATKWARERGLPLIAVQHHHAHVAGCMAEHGLDGPVIGLALDGTGYGTDGKVWGGEVLIVRLKGANLAGFERFAHLEYVPMPGGEAAIKEPWRMAFAALRTAGFNAELAASLAGAEASEARVLMRMMERGINSPMTSSLGRLFDAVAAVVMNRRVVDYEAQAAIELEGAAVDERDRFEQGEYVLELHEAEESLGSVAEIRTGKMWKAVLEDLWRGVPARRISARFHAGIAEGFINAAGNARIETGINTVALSGGCMANRRLARLLREGLKEEGFEVFQHRQVSPSDGGLSYGQLAVAAARLDSHLGDKGKSVVKIE
jgi:hydrogenase maturation protein HypF